MRWSLKKIPSLGEQEMDLLKYVGEHSPIAVREVAAHFEREKGLARTTVLTVMERLRKKGFLSRAKTDGIFLYSAKIRTGDVLTHKVSDFIERTLGGSLSPLINYFLDNKDLTADEIKQLKAMAAKLEGEK
jgi:predicted transcriptional regulator